MTKNHLRLPALLLCLLFFAHCQPPSKSTDGLSQFVNPFVGTGGHGHTYPGATVPFGMVQLSPDTRLTGWDGCSGYHYTDHYIYGFSHTHLSGTGIPDYGDVLLMPCTGPVLFNNGADDEPGYRSAFSKSSETAFPGYYGVELDKNGTKVDLTTTARAGFHRYTFQETENAHVLLDLAHRDRVINAAIRQISPTEIEGLRISKDWAEEQHVYFTLQFSEPIKLLQLWDSTEVAGPTKNYFSGTAVKAAIFFDLPETKELKVKVGLSAVDPAGAGRNLNAEIPHWDFEQTLQEATQLWEKQLGKIDAEGLDETVTRNFYTALYHTSVVPNLYSDVDGRYRGMDKKIYTLPEGESHYTVFSLWDTYRATHPLYTLIEQERTNAFVRTFLRQYDQGGKLPMWELAANYTGCMIGYHAVPVIADAYVKGMRDYEVEKAFEAMQQTAMTDELGKIPYQNYGYIPSNMEPESVSKTLEYAYNDWCIATMAEQLGEDSIAAQFYQRAQYYKNVFYPDAGLMAAKRNSSWILPFDPTEVNFHFTEANSWQYSFYVPQDVSGFIQLHGGPEKLEAKLDELFNASSETSGRDQADITGLIGQYAHGNEPSHHMAYLYNYVGKPWKTQQRARQIMDELYADAPDGLSGNEDCGQMSAWYVFSAMGIYPVTPGSLDYIIGTPMLKRATINLENGKTFAFTAENLSKQNMYIQEVRLNGQPYPKSFIKHNQIMEGGTLEFIMGENPNESWASAPENWPKQAITQQPIVPMPYFSRAKAAFFDQDTLEINCPDPDMTIYYTLDGKNPDGAKQRGKQYEGPIEINETTKIKAVAYHPAKGQSGIIEGEFLKIPKGRKISIAQPYANQYAAGGDIALIDFLYGGNDFRTGEWQGYHGIDLDATVDLGVQSYVEEAGIRFLQDENSWIFMPLEVQFSFSSDGVNFTDPIIKKHNILPLSKGTKIETFKVPVQQSIRYIKVVGKNMGLCPEDHKGAGGKAWVFADEIIID